MKLKHIYINKEGEPMGIDPNCTSSKFNDSLLPFEDGELANVYAILSDTGYKPDTLIPVDLEVEVVEIDQRAEQSGDVFYDIYIPPRKVLRIKN